MIQLSANQIKKYYGAELVLEGVSFEINEGERAAFVGPNGCGKSTLLKIICKKETPDEGSIAIRKNITVGYLEQMPPNQGELTVLEVLQQAFADVYEAKAELKELEVKMADPSGNLEELLKRYNTVSEKYEHLGGYELEERYSKVCQGLAITQSMLEKRFESLSGGEKTLIGLAKVLLISPDVLILDEPTNHLDMGVLAWVEDFLKKYKGTVLFVSHDRYFLNAVTTKVIDMEFGTAKEYPYTYEVYLKEKLKERQQREAEYKEQQKKIAKLEEAIKRMRLWAKQADNEAMFKRAKSMEKRLERMDKVEKPKTMNYKAKLEFDDTSRSGNDVLVVEHLRKTFKGKELLKEGNLNIFYQEHIGMIGPNGCGKTTFLRMLFGTEPVDGGTIRIGSSLKIGYLPQNVTFEREDLTVLETFRDHLKISEGDARGLLARHLFTKETVFKKVGTLSGGERSRLKFAIMMQSEVNFLILDEPTNHLDIPSREQLEESLLSFSGTILMISHDRYFLNRLATRIVEFEDGQLISYAGGYNDYVEEKRKRLLQPVVLHQSEKDKPVVEKQTTASDKTMSPYTRNMKIKQLEEELAVLEDQKSELEAWCEEAANDYEKLTQLLQEKTDVEEKINQRMEEWLNLSEAMEG